MRHGSIPRFSTLGSALPGEIERRGIPYVMVNREIVADHRARSAAVPDKMTGAGLVADLLVDLAHTTMAMISGPAETSTGAERLAGFRDALARRGVALHPDAGERVPFSIAGGAEAMDRLLDRPVTAVFCANDVLAIGALETLAGRGLDIPGDLSIVGFDDIPLAALASVDLTTVTVDLAGLARDAIHHLVARARGSDVIPARLVQQVELRLRGTHGPPGGR